MGTTKGSALVPEPHPYISLLFHIAYRNYIKLKFNQLFPNINTELKLHFLEKVLSLLRQGISLHFQHKTMCVLHIIWLFPCFSLVLPWRQDDWLSFNVPCCKGRDWISLLLLQLCQNTKVCLCADCRPNLPRLCKLNSKSIQIYCTCSCFGGHIPVQHPGIDPNCINQVLGNSKLPLFWISF